MVENVGYSVFREYVILTVAYSVVAAILIELLLVFWRVTSSRARIKVRLMVLLFPPPLALLYPAGRVISPLAAIVPSWQLLDTETFIQMANRHAPWLVYFVIVVSGATGIHFVAQVIVPMLRWRNRSTRVTSPESYVKLLRAYSSVVQSTGLSPKLTMVDRGDPAAEVRGVFSPSVVVSSGLVELLDEEELEGVLAHEFAHIDHADIGLNWIATTLRFLMFYNPLAALVHNLIALDAERVCDDAAVSIVTRPTAFASALIKIYRACAKRTPRRFSTRRAASLTVRVASWENHALRSFTIERIRRVLDDKRICEIPFVGARLVLAGTALAAILLFVT